MGAQKKAKSQTTLRRSCGAMAAHMALLERYPAFRLAQMRLEGATERQRSAPAAKAWTPVKIKVIVHVVYKNATENISDAQIRSQIVVLNRDFRATNPDKSKTPPPWKGLVADSGISFVLDRVTRTQTTKGPFTWDDKVKKAATGGIAPINPKKYLNLWVCALSGGLLGYAQFPGGPQTTDGVVINYRAFGTMGTASSPFNKGRTATHEIGHYFNLRHIWGDTPGCSGGDMVADTPNCSDANTGKPKWPRITCNNGPHGDMFMNYMDYTDDDTMFMFTPQQVARMHVALMTLRSGLL